MTQEDGFVEVQVNLYNKTPLIRWVRPVIIKKLRLLFDTYCMVIVTRESGLDFSDIENMDKEEYLAWMLYGAHKSYASLSNRRPNITIEDAVQWLKGMLIEDRKRAAETIQLSREIGEIADSYQKARNRPELDNEGEPLGKKGKGSDLQS